MFKVQNTNYFQIPFLTRPFAIAKIAGGEESKETHGFVKFFSCKDGVLVLSEISNLPKTETNFFAIHIHENDECDSDFFPRAGIMAKEHTRFTLATFLPFFLQAERQFRLF